MFDSGWERVVDGIATVTGCDRDALAALIGHPPAADSLEPAVLLDRIGAAERVAQAVQAVQLHDLAAFNTCYLTGDGTGDGIRDSGPVDGLRDPRLPAASRMAVVEVGCELQVAQVTAGCRISDAVRAVEDYPDLVDLVGTGRVSMAGLRRVLDTTVVLDPDRQHTVDTALASEAARRVLTPGELGRAATRRVLAVDPDAATRRVARARRDRSVRLGDPVDGTAGLYAVLRAEEAVSIFAGLDRTARGMRSGGDDRCLDTLRADLLVEHLTGRSMTRMSTDPTDPTAHGDDGTETRGGGTDPGGGNVDGAGLPRVWTRYHGVEPAFDQHPPPPVPAPDPAPDDPVWDSYLTHRAPTAPPSPPPPHEPPLAAEAPPDPPPDPPPAPGTDPALNPGDQGAVLRLVRPPPDDSEPAAPAEPDEPAEPADPAEPAELAPAEPADPAERAEPVPGSWRHRVDVEVQVVVSLGTVLGLDDNPGMLRGYGALPADTVREIIDVAEATGATTRLRGLFCDPVDGRLLAMESTGRLFTGGLRQFCCWRDQTDRLTGSRLSDIDHVLAHHQHGPTSAANAQGLGVHTNRIIKQHHDVTVRTLPTPTRHDGLDHYRTHAPDIEWTLPSGHTHTRTPPPVLGPGTDPADEPNTDSPLEAHLIRLVHTAAG